MGSYFQLYTVYSEVALPSSDLIWLSEKPLLVTILETCNPKSIKPNNYKRGNIINTNMNFTNKKGYPRNVFVGTSGVF